MIEAGPRQEGDGAGLTRSMLGVFGANVANLVLSVGNSIFLTRLLGVEGKGEFAIFTASFGLLSLLLGLGLDASIRFFVARDRVDRDRILTAVLGYAALCGLLVAGLARLDHALFDHEIFLPRSRQTPLFEGVLGGVVAATLVQTNLKSVFTGRRAFQVVNRLTVIFAALSVVLWGGLFWAEKEGVLLVGSGGVFQLYLALTLLHALAFTVLAMTRLGLRFRLRLPESGLVRAMVGYAFLSFLAGAAQFLNYRLDYWLVQGLAGTSMLGLYSLASGLAGMMWVLPRSVSTVLMPSMAAAEEEASLADAARVARVVTAALAALALPLALTAPVWIRLAYGSEFVEAWIPFTILLVGTVPFAVTVVLAAVFAAHDRIGVNLQASVLGLVLTVVLDLALIPRFGLAGAAVASASSYLGSTALMVVRFRALSGLGWLAPLVPRAGDLRMLRPRPSP